ncbi:MAG: hypothetical protein FJ387_12360 [Verrucomicrobia bacterium]|nr:hypothetical protein [Verrucomicrobiota bacterium]
MGSRRRGGRVAALLPRRHVDITTAGFQQVAEDRHQAYDRPKQSLVRELVKDAAWGLRAWQLPTP